MTEQGLIAYYPWQAAQWSQVSGLIDRDRLPHALLLAGPKGTGKRRFAEALAYKLLCCQPQLGGACGQCRQCQLLLAGTHPDLKRLAPDEPGKQIKVDSVRGLLGFIGQTAQQGGYKVVIIEPTEAMNVNAANALLKNLEEPSDDTLLLLVTDAPGSLLATIKSRCQQLAFPVPQHNAVEAWLSDYLQDSTKAAVALKEASGRPLEALRLVDSGAVTLREQMVLQLAQLLLGKHSAVTIADQWKDEDLAVLFEWLQQRLMAMIRYRFAAEIIEQPWDGFANKAGKGMYPLLDKVNAARLLVLGGSNPNKQLLLEDILLSFCALFAAQ